MTGINKDLNEKITQLNIAMEEANNHIFTANIHDYWQVKGYSGTRAEVQAREDLKVGAIENL